MRPLNLTVVAASLGILFAVGCDVPQGRIMGDEERDYVGARAAGSATWDRLINDGVTKLLDRVTRHGAGGGQMKVAFVALENKTAEELGDQYEQIRQFIDTSINTSEKFRTISDRFVDAGLRESRLRTDQLFIPKHQRTFAATMEAAGNPVEFLLFGTLTSGTTRGDDVRQVGYALTLELVDIQSGDNFKETVRLRKAYTR